MEINASNYWEECFSVATDTTPAFLLKGLERILLAGKSMHLIESIGKLKHIQEGMVHTSPSKGGVVSPRGGSGGDTLMTSPGPTSDLYRDFVRTLSQQMPPPVLGLVGSCDRTPRGGATGTRRKSHDRASPKRSSDESADSGYEFEVKGVEHYDALVRSYLQLIKTNSTPTSPPGEWGGVGQELTPPSSSLVPLNLLIQDNLHRLLQQHCRTVSLDHTHVPHPHYRAGWHAHCRHLEPW